MKIPHLLPADICALVAPEGETPEMRLRVAAGVLDTLQKQGPAEPREIVLAFGLTGFRKLMLPDQISYIMEDMLAAGTISEVGDCLHITDLGKQVLAQLLAARDADSMKELGADLTV